MQIFKKCSMLFGVILSLALSLALVLSGCGGGGGGESTTTPPTTYSISGRVNVGGVALAGVTISLTGAATATTTTDASGNYSLSGLANGSYTVTPSKTGYTFNPISSAVSVSGANVSDKNFTATASSASTYSISGTVSGAASSGVTITLSGDNTGSVVTGAGGTYTISGLVAGNYTVTPSLSGYTFSPINIAITLVAANSTANNFVATAIPVPHSISGTVSGAISSGVTITVTGAATATATTDAGGNYSVTGLSDGSYTVTPSKTGYTFTPNSTSVTVSGAHVTGTNFTSAVVIVPTYTLSGTVTGPWYEGVTITMSGAASGTTTTNASGNYSFANLPAGTYTLTPSLAGYTYSPSAPAVDVSADTTRNFVASSAVTSYSISGTVSKTTSKTGPIYIRVFNTGCSGDCSPAGGTSIPSAGAYTIRGLQPGSYVVHAEMDTLGTGVRNATNPAGSSATATITAANLTGVNVVVADRTLPVPVTPTGLSVSPGNNSAFVQYSAPQDANGEEIATSYKIYWGTDTGATSGTPVTFTAQGGKSPNFLNGLSNGPLYFKISALVGTTESAASAVVGPVTIGATTGANTVSGTVSFPGTATGPLLVGLYSNSGIYFTSITSPVSPQSYSISGVTNGSYQAFAVIDMNNNGLVDSGDITNTNGNIPAITVSGNTTSNLTLTSSSATASVNTDHWFDGTNHNYSLILGVSDGTKRSVAVTLISGLTVAVPFDMGADSNNNMWIWLNTISPTVGDTYVFKVTFSDGTTQNISGSVTAVLSSFAQSLVAQTTPPGTTTVPLFTWAAPASPPASYTYRLNLWGPDSNWYYPKDNALPSTTLSALYNADGRASIPALTTGNQYTWQVRVEDANGNSASRQTTYTP